MFDPELLEAAPSYVLDRELGGVGDEHHCHHACLDRIAYDDIGRIRHRTRHVGAEDDDAGLANLANSICDVTAHQRTRQDKSLRAMQPSDRPHSVGKLLLTDERNGVDRDSLATHVVTAAFSDSP